MTDILHETWRIVLGGRRPALVVACAIMMVAVCGILAPRSAWTEDQKLLLWMDNSITGLVGTGFEVDPNDQYTATLEHASEWSFGDLFIFVDFTQFDETSDSGDDWTWYGEIAPRLSFGKIFDKDLSFSMFGEGRVVWKDTLLAMTYEKGRDPEVTESFLLGVGFDLDINGLGIFGDDGFNYIQLNFYARNEMNDSAGDDPDRGFKDLQITMAASYPFEVGDAAFLVDGFFDWVAGFGPQARNLHVVPQFKLDIGNFYGHPKVLYAGVEVDYWHNKYGLEGSGVFDTDQLAISALLKYQF